MDDISNENVDFETFDYFMNSDEWELLNKMPENTWVNDLKNKRNGNLVAYFPFKKKTIKDPSIYWLCKCDCGSFVMVRGDRFKGLTHCGCNDIKNYIGEKHDHLTCTGQHTAVNDNGFKTVRLNVVCDCGKTMKWAPQKFTNLKCCGMKCPYKMSDEDKKANGNRMKNIFYNGTNIAKIGRRNNNKNGSSGYLGVCYNASMNKYLAYITFRGNRENLGYYKFPETAYKVRLAAQDILHAEFLNELEKDEFIKNNKYLSELVHKVKKQMNDAKED